MDGYFGELDRSEFYRGIEALQKRWYKRMEMAEGIMLKNKYNF